MIESPTCVRYPLVRNFDIFFPCMLRIGRLLAILGTVAFLLYPCQITSSELSNIIELYIIHLMGGGRMTSKEGYLYFLISSGT